MWQTTIFIAQGSAIIQVGNMMQYNIHNTAFYKLVCFFTGKIDKTFQIIYTGIVQKNVLKPDNIFSPVFYFLF